MSPDQILHQLRALGIQAGDVLVVHTSFRNIRPISGGIEGLIAALRTAVGEDGTLVMPSMNYEDDLPFSVESSSCPEMGAVADTFWRMPGVLRSDSPHAFAAVGRHAAAITAPHPPDVPHGLNSPVGRTYELNGKILLLGVDHDANTTIHLGENLAEVRYRVPHHVTVFQSPSPAEVSLQQFPPTAGDSPSQSPSPAGGGLGRGIIRVDYGETDHCGERFAEVGGWLDENGLQHMGQVGHGQAILCRARDVVAVVLEHLAADEFAFLHPPGTDEECDAAWASIENMEA